ERGFAATRRSDERDEIAAIDLQVDVAERLHLAVAGLKGERDAARVDRQSWSGGGRFETRPRAVCATRQGAARRLRQGPQYHHQLRPADVLPGNRPTIRPNLCLYRQDIGHDN